MEKEKGSRDAMIETILHAGAVALQFGRVKRVTYHQDGKTLESDSDHTVMLALIATSLAHSYAPHLKKGLVAQYALVHDLVEVYAGDTPTFGVSINKKDEKDEKEKKALHRLKEEFEGVLPWIPETISHYESLGDPESRFVKSLDKCMPKITHILNSGAYLKEHGKTRKETEKFFAEQLSELKNSYGHDQELVLHIIEALMKKVLREVF